MTSSEPGKTITSTADLVPDGWKGYLKAIVAFVGFLGALAAFIQPMLPEDSGWVRWCGIVVALAGWVGVYYAKNYVQPVVVR
jgi:hypothetical protein